MNSCHRQTGRLQSNQIRLFVKVHNIFYMNPAIKEKSNCTLKAWQDPHNQAQPLLWLLFLGGIIAKKWF